MDFLEMPFVSAGTELCMLEPNMENVREAPHIILLAGPNGAGKSTTAPLLLRDAFAVDEFVNADVIAQGLSAFDPEGAALEAGKIMLKRLRELAAKRANFAFETTLASRSFAPWLAGLRKTGYHVHLFFLTLPSPDDAIRRVGSRVKLGGHFVEGEIVRRRFAGGLRNLFQLYMPVVTTWKIYNNLNPSQPVDIARYDGYNTLVYDWDLFDKLKKEYGDG